MIEKEMERFREHEKEFKMKQFSKRALMADYEAQGNFVERQKDWLNDNSSNDDYNSEDDGSYSGIGGDSNDNDSDDDDKESSHHSE